MLFTHLLQWAWLLPLCHAADTIVGVYLVTRHGDRTPKLFPPTGLTPLGIQEVHEDGVYFRDRYISSDDNSTEIKGISTDLVKLSEISPTAPGKDLVLQNSAAVFLQGLYPPTTHVETLRDGEKIEAPINTQLIPIQNTVTVSGNIENTLWVQGVSGCANAVLSAIEYSESSEYQSLLESTRDFYKRLDPVINQAFAPDDQSFKNAYASMLIPRSIVHSPFLNR